MSTYHRDQIYTQRHKFLDNSTALQRHLRNMGEYHSLSPPSPVTGRAGILGTTTCLPYPYSSLFLFLISPRLRLRLSFCACLPCVFITLSPIIPFAYTAPLTTETNPLLHHANGRSEEGANISERPESALLRVLGTLDQPVANQQMFLKNTSIGGALGRGPQAMAGRMGGYAPPNIYQARRPGYECLIMRLRAATPARNHSPSHATRVGTSAPCQAMASLRISKSPNADPILALHPPVRVTYLQCPTYYHDRLSCFPTLLRTHPLGLFGGQPPFLP
ncbi:hypothetical protein N656DRAFT_75504 [Canariomyces notabilis]|uniref:Uncharacterized protein n=1 Tax=Canariomyces notabilis TaxID=2074819 RepID=A0AAN6TE63_9PEZI|nr:hypothetical protein N656DRAFT_75504 [Canariomyces arenarius]